MHEPSSHLAVFRILNLTDLQLDVLLRMLKMTPDADGVVRVQARELLAALGSIDDEDDRLDALRAVVSVLASKVHTIQPNAGRKVTFVLLSRYAFDEDDRGLQFQFSPLALELLQPLQP